MSKTKNQKITPHHIHWSVFVVFSVAVTSFLVYQINSSVDEYHGAFNIAHAAPGVILSLSPASSTVAANQNFTVSVNLATAGTNIDGVDIYSLHFTPSILQVVDADSNTAGVQIAPGTAFANTAINTVDNATGIIRLSQSTSGGSHFNGTGLVATITFQGIASGTSPVTFDFTAGSTADTNAAYLGVDELASVTNASFTVDATAPTVALTTPAAGASLSGAGIAVSATASDNIAVIGVQFKLDGNNLGAEDTSSPYSITWDTTTTSNGSHSLTAVARDGAGNTTTSSARSVTVANTTPDTTPPTVSISAPTNGASVNGASVSITANASDNVGVAGVQFKIDGVNLGAEDTASPFSATWNTTTVANGSHTITAVARDAANNTTTSTGVGVTVNNPDITPPTVSVTAPTNGATVTGASVTVSANASDNIGVAGVQFKLDGVNIGSEDTSSPYSITWNTTTATNGSHTITAVARDAANNTTTSTGVGVTVSNASFAFTMSNGGNKTVVQGSNVTNSVTATLSSGTTQAVTFSTSGLPSGVTASYIPTSCSPTCTSTLTLTASASATVGTSTITVTGTAGATTANTTFSLTVSTFTFTRSISINSLQGRTTKIVTGTLDVLNNATKALIKSFPFTTNSSGIATITFDIPLQTAYLKVKAIPYLSRLLAGIDLNSNVTYSFPILLTGDINGDNIVNSVDFSSLNTNWFTSNAGSDLNGDGLVNSIDFSFMNSHWLATGEQ